MYIRKRKYNNMCKDLDINHCLTRNIEDIRTLYDIPLDDYSVEYNHLPMTDKITIVCNYVEWVLRYIYDNNLDFKFTTDFGKDGRNEHYIEVSFDKYYVLCMLSYYVISTQGVDMSRLPKIYKYIEPSNKLSYSYDIVVHFQYFGKLGWDNAPTDWFGVGAESSMNDYRYKVPVEEVVRKELPDKLKALYERLPDELKAWYILHGCNLYDILCIIK